MDRYRNKYRGDSIRIRNWNYGSPGYYYVTICTRDRMHYFGDVVISDETPEDIQSPAPWADVCGGFAATHNYASLPPAAPPPHGTGIRSTRSHVTVELTEIGKIAYQNWIDIPAHFPFVILDEFVVMPDHIHGILCFQKPGYRERNVNSFGPQSENLGSVIRNFKGATKAYATSHEIQFAWQARYHDDVITSGEELDRIRTYIRNNPAKWLAKSKATKTI